MTYPIDPLNVALGSARRTLGEAALYSTEEEVREACQILIFYGDLNDARSARAALNELDGLTRYDDGLERDRPTDALLASLICVLAAGAVAGLIVWAMGGF